MIKNDIIKNNREINHKLNFNNFINLAREHKITNYEDCKIDKLYIINKKIIINDKEFKIQSPINVLDVVVHQTLMNKDISFYLPFIEQKFLILFFLKDKSNNTWIIVLDNKKRIFTIIGQEEVVSNEFIKEVNSLINSDEEIVKVIEDFFKKEEEEEILPF